jgi:subtilisin family serine protease
MRHCLGSTRQLVAGAVLTAVAAAVASIVGSGAAQAGPAEGAIQGAGTAGAIKDHYIVVLNDTARSPRAAADLASRYGGALGRTYDRAVHGFSVRMTEAAAKRLAGNPAVAYVEQDHQVAMAETLPWGLDRIDQHAAPLDGRYTYPTVASNVTAYVIDTGILTTHPAFGSRARSGYDAVDGSGTDCNGHGTHVAGTIGSGPYGVAKGVRLVAVRVLNCNGSGTYEGVIAGINWVTANAVKPAVANMSLGGGASKAIDAAVRASIASGVTYAVAAGNANANACTTSPARVPEAITVGATYLVDNTDVRAGFSNYGSCLDIFAPGVGILSTWNNGGTVSISGTSMASPHVAGAAALVLGAHPSYTPAQVASTLLGKAMVGKVADAEVNTPNRMLDTSGLPAPPAPASTCAAITNGANVTIPDAGAASSAIPVGCTLTASANTQVTVHIKHTWRGDLAIYLIAPDGTVLPALKNPNPYDGAPDVDGVYVVNALGKTRAGTWKLQVYDTEAGDTGFIDSWSLKL